MKKYLGVKIVEAEPMTKGQFIGTQKPYSAISDNEENKKEGYKVVYEDGYTSWSPKEVFEKVYNPMDGHKFGLAIEALKQGHKVARSGWNGKGMYVFIIGTDSSQPGIGGWTYTNGRNDNLPLLPFIAMKTADEKVVPWLASQTDLLSEDWTIVE